MDNNQQIILNVESLDNNDGGISLKRIWAFTKLAFVRAVLFMAVAAILATGVVLVLNQISARRTNVVAGVVFVYDGIEQGLLPNNDSGLFNPANIITTSTIYDARETLLAKEEISELPTVAQLNNALSFTPILSPARQQLEYRAANGDQAAINELNTNPFFATTFTLSLNEPANIGLSNDTAVLFVDTLMQVAFSNFITEYVVADPINYNFVPAVNGVSHYLAHATLFENYLNSIIQTLQNKASIRSSTSTSFAKLVNRGNALRKNNLFVYRAFVATNSIVSDPYLELVNINYARNTLLDRQAFVQNSIGVLEDLLDNRSLVNTNIIILPNGEERIVTVPTAQYLEFTARLAELNKELIVINAELAQLQLQQDTIEDFLYDAASLARLVALQSEAQDKLNNLSELLIAFVDDANSLITEFNSRYVYNSIVRVSQNALVSVNQDRLGNTMTIIIYGALILVGLLAALFLTHLKKKKALSLAATQAENAENDKPEESITEGVASENTESADTTKAK